jgi:hypothetical protein
LALLDVLPEMTARRRLKELAGEREVAGDALQAATEALRAAQAPRTDPRELATGLRALVRAGHWREALEAIVPPRPPYGVIFGRDRSIALRGVLDPAAGSARSSSRSGEIDRAPRVVLRLVAE